MSTAWSFYSGFPVLFQLWCPACGPDSSKGLWDFPGSVAHLWCLLRMQCVFTEAFQAAHSGTLPPALFQQMRMLGAPSTCWPRCPWGAVGPFTPRHYRLSALYLTCLSVCLPGSSPPPPPDCELSTGGKCFFLVVLQGLARAQRMLSLEWRMSREHVVLGKPTAHWASVGCPWPHPGTLPVW